MLNVRVRYTDALGTWWTGPIRNPAALAALLAAHRQRSIATEVYDDREHLAIAEQCFEVAEVPGSGGALGKLTWGLVGTGQPFCVAVARLPRATGVLLHDEL